MFVAVKVERGASPPSQLANWLQLNLRFNVEWLWYSSGDRVRVFCNIPKSKAYHLLASASPGRLLSSSVSPTLQYFRG